VDHLALKVSDQERSRRFYETYCGFGARPRRRPDYASVKARDPDGHVVEFSWEPT
jgi:predicted lactoylglutathione lyase